MEAVHKFLIELDNRIQGYTLVLNNASAQRNNYLELNNIFFECNIDKNNITTDSILALSPDRFARILELLNVGDALRKADKLYESAHIVNLYKRVIVEYGDIEEASQYYEAENWLRSIVLLISNSVNAFANGHESSTNNLKNIVERYRNYRAMFIGDKLVKPILKLNEFNSLLSDLALPMHDQVKIKKYIGQANIGLVIGVNLETQPDESWLEKYTLILNKKEASYASEIQQISALISKLGIILKIDCLEAQIVKVTELKPEIPYKCVQNALVCLLLGKEIKEYKELIETIEDVKDRKIMRDSVIKNCEELIRISRKHTPRKDKKTIKKKNNSEAKDLIEHAQKIINIESDFLRSINPDEYKRFSELLNIMDTQDFDSTEGEKYRLALIIESLKQELKVFTITAAKYIETPEVFGNNYKQQIGTIREYLTTYEILKARVAS